MACLGDQFLPPTNLGRVDEEMVPPERYSSRKTGCSSKKYNRERRDWDVRRRSTGDRKNGNWRDAEVLDQRNDRINIEVFTGMDLRGTMDSRTGIGLTGIIVDSKKVTDGISSEIGVRVRILIEGTEDMVVL
ncbi:hypothetical protein TNCV_1604221 [Trichonephila clavipes]|nr:hypothetical protein TNCV_1604221 [Trichonephila clavipes]